MTWFNPTAYVELFPCDYCGERFDEDDLSEIEDDKWACDDCHREYDAEQQAIREDGEDAKLHARLEATE